MYASRYSLRICAGHHKSSCFFQTRPHFFRRWTSTNGPQSHNSVSSAESTEHDGEPCEHVSRPQDEDIALHEGRVRATTPYIRRHLPMSPLMVDTYHQKRPPKNPKSKFEDRTLFQQQLARNPYGMLSQSLVFLSNASRSSGFGISCSNVQLHSYHSTQLLPPRFRAHSSSCDRKSMVHATQSHFVSKDRSISDY